MTPLLQPRSAGLLLTQYPRFCAVRIYDKCGGGRAVFFIYARDGIPLHPNRHIGDEKTVADIAVCQLRQILIKGERSVPCLQRVSDSRLYRLSIQRYAVFQGVGNIERPTRCLVIDVFSVMWRITKRESQRGRDRIVGGITEGVFRRDFPGIGKEAVRVRIILLRELLHIEGQKFSLHHDGAILSRHDRACNVRAAPVPLGGIGIGRLCTTSCQQQEQQDSRSYFLFHIYRLLSFEFRLYLPHRPLIIKIFSGIRTAAV